VKVLKHKLERTYSFEYKHTAVIQTEGHEDDVTEEELACMVAWECGYPPPGYDLYRPRVKEISKGVYQVEWLSGTTAD